MEKLIIVIMLLSCALLPSINVSQAMFKEIGGLLLAALFIVLWVWKHNKWLAAFLLWLVIRMFLPPVQPRGMITLTNVFMAAMLYLGTQYIDLNWKNIRKAIAITLGLQITAIFCQKLNIFFCWNSINDGGRIWGLFGNSNWSGAYIAMTMPIALSLAKENKWYLASLLGIPALALMGSMFSLFAGVFGVLFVAYVHYRKTILKHNFDKTILAGIIMMVVLTILVPVTFLDGGRMEMWRRAYKFCIYNPKPITYLDGQDPAKQSHFIQGRGLGEAYTILPMIQDKQCNELWRQVHCEPLQVLFEYGFIGLILAGGIVVTTLRKLNQSNYFVIGALLALFIDSLGFFPFRTAPIGFMALILLGAIDKNAILL